MGNQFPLKALIAAVVALICSIAQADDEISLFDGYGTATAYIADNLTIYLWSGKPVAYLDDDPDGGLHIYGFNGKHLGWFVRGIARDHQGHAACVVKEVLQSTEFEPFKSFKQFQPFKSFKEFAPFRPYFTQDWSEIPCMLAAA